MEVNEIYCIGSNKFGQAGAGKKYHNQTFATFSKIIFPVFIKQVVCGSHHSGLLTLEGYVYMMGSNINGALGTSTANINYSHSPILVQQLNDVSKISSGYYHMCAISEGKLYSWGKGVDGQLGTGKQINCSIPTLVQSFGDDVQEVSCGLNHTLVKTTNQKCYAFGNGIYGQLGLGSNKNSLYPIQVKIDQISQIAAGQNFSLFLKGSVVYGSGDNSNGQISHQLKKKYALQPTQIKVGKVTSIRAGKFSVAAIQDKALCVWGIKTGILPITLSQDQGYVMDFQTGGNLVYCLNSQGELYQWQPNISNISKTFIQSQLKQKTILGFSIGQSHSIILGDIIGHINPSQQLPHILQNIEEQIQKNQQEFSKANSSMPIHNRSQSSELPSICSQHFSRTPSSIMRQPTNFLKQQTKGNIEVQQFRKQLPKALSKPSIQISQFLRDKSNTNLSRTVTKPQLEVSDCMKKIQQLMGMLQKNSKLSQMDSTFNFNDYSRKSTRSRFDKSDRKQSKQNRIGQKNQRYNRQLIMQLRQKQLKISQLQQKLSRKDIEIESQRQLINLLRKINCHNQ